MMRASGYDIIKDASKEIPKGEDTTTTTEEVST